MTKHIGVRMNQRGIKGDLVRLALEFGDVEGDRYRLGRKALQSLLAELDSLRSVALKALDKGGLTVVEDGGQLITTYRGGRA